MQVKDNNQQQLDCNGVKYIYVINLHDYFESFQSHPKIVILDSPSKQQYLQQTNNTIGTQKHRC
jgi:hypothetical protein